MSLEEQKGKFTSLNACFISALLLICIFFHFLPVCEWMLDDIMFTGRLSKFNFLEKVKRFFTHVEILGFKVLSSLALKTSRGGENTVSLGSFFQCVIFFILKKIFFISRHNLPRSNACTEILSSHGVVSLIPYQAVQLTVYPDSQVLFSCSWDSQSLACIGESDYFFSDTRLYP